MFRTTIVLLVVLAIFFTNAFAQKLVCNRRNEIYQCGSSCQTTCDNLGKPCSIVNIGCIDACYCKEGYARANDNSSCIPISDCPN